MLPRKSVFNSAAKLRPLKKGRKKMDRNKDEPKWMRGEVENDNQRKLKVLL